MRKIFGLLSIVITLAIIYYLYLAQIPKNPSGELQPQQQIDLTGIKKDLLGIAQAERLYVTANGSYGSIEQLQADGSLNISGTHHRGYQFEAIIEGAAKFKIIARPSDAGKKDWPTLTIDETMEIRQE
jgi:hypothetical protein